VWWLGFVLHPFSGEMSMGFTICDICTIANNIKERQDKIENLRRRSWKLNKTLLGRKSINCQISYMMSCNPDMRCYSLYSNLAYHHAD